MIHLVREDIKFPLHIGVLGLHPNAGATTISILIAAYFKFICGMDTIVLEQSQKHDMCSLSEKSLNRKESFFIYHKIHFDVSQNGKESEKDSRGAYQCYIHDLGCNYARSREYEKECHFIICPYRLTSWIYSIEQLKDRKEKLGFHMGKVRFLGNMLTREEQRRAGKAIISYDCIGYEPDIFSPCTKTIEVFHNIIFS